MTTREEMRSERKRLLKKKRERLGVEVYALLCPETELVGYVGVSMDAEARLNCHLTISAHESYWHLPQYAWIRSLLNRDMSPVLRKLTRTTWAERHKEERAWAKFIFENNLGNEQYRMWYRHSMEGEYRLGRRWSNRKY